MGRRDAPRGRPGAGQAVAVALAVPPGAIAGWVDRLVWHGILFEGPLPHEGDGLSSLHLTDPDGLALALVGDVLFELATDAPGFAVDEAPDAFGAALRLPPQYEAARAEIERRLPPLRVPGGAPPTAAP